MSDKDSKYMFPKSSHPSVYDTLQGTRFQTRSRGSLQHTPRGSQVGSRTVTDREPEHYSYTRRTNMKSEYIGLKRPVNDGSRLYLSYLWDENKLKSHVERLVNVKPKVDCGAPNVNSTELFNMQKIRDWNRRKQKLDYDNKTIVGRLSDIMTNGRSDLDCWNPSCYKPDGSYYKREARKKRERENSFILERLMSVRVVHPGLFLC